MRRVDDPDTQTFLDELRDGEARFLAALEAVDCEALLAELEREVERRLAELLEDVGEPNGPVGKC